MSTLRHLARATMLLVVAAASFLITVPGTGCLLCLGYEYLEVRAALREADAMERVGQPGKAEARRDYADSRLLLAREYVPGGVGLTALIAVAGGLRIGLAWGRRGAEKQGPGSSDQHATARRACTGLLWAILVGMGVGVLVYFGLGYFFVFVLDD